MVDCRAVAAPEKMAVPTEFNVILEAGFEAAKKIGIIKVVREIAGLGLAEAKAFVEGAPKPVKEGVDKATAEKYKKSLEDAGARSRSSQPADRFRIIQLAGIPYAEFEKNFTRGIDNLDTAGYYNFYATLTIAVSRAAPADGRVDERLSRVPSVIVRVGFTLGVGKPSRPLT